MDLTDLPRIDNVAWRMFRDGDYTALTDLLNEDLEGGGHGSFRVSRHASTGFALTTGLPSSISAWYT